MKVTSRRTPMPERAINDADLGDVRGAASWHPRVERWLLSRLTGGGEWRTFIGKANDGVPPEPWRRGGFQCRLSHPVKARRACRGRSDPWESGRPPSWR